MRIKLCSVFVDNQDRALRFYTEVLGFKKKNDLPAGEFRWITVVSPEGPDDLELLLEPNQNPAAQAYQAALFQSGTPFTIFFAEDVEKEYERLQGLGAVFHTPLTQAEWGAYAVLEDTFGNLIQISQA